MTDSTSTAITSQIIWQRHLAGEPLILAIHAIGLKGMNRATVLRWILSGRVPAIRMGRRYLTVQSAVDELAISGQLGAPLPKVQPDSRRPAKKTKSKGKKPARDSHTEAIENLRRKGLMN